MSELAEADSSKPSNPPSEGNVAKSPLAPPYTAFSPARRNTMLAVVTWTAFLGPLSGNIYLPLLPILERELRVSATLINFTVTVFMLVFAVAVLVPSFKPPRGEEVTCAEEVALD
jgi:hypothetical protein